MFAKLSAAVSSRVQKVGTLLTSSIAIYRDYAALPRNFTLYMVEND